MRIGMYSGFAAPRFYSRTASLAASQPESAAAMGSAHIASGGSGSVKPYGPNDLYAMGGTYLQLGQAAEASPPASSYPSSQGVHAGAGAAGMRKYINIGAGYDDASLAAMNNNRKSLGARIQSVVDAAGIKLGKDEKLALSVDSKNQFKVGGLKDKNKAEAIQEALNNDPGLGREMRRHVATAKIAEFSKTENDYTDWLESIGLTMEDLGEDPGDLFTHRGMRSFVIEEYLQDNAEASLSDLSLAEDGSGGYAIQGMSSKLAQLVADDAELGETIANILENGETSATFAVSFEFANGVLSDPSSDMAARTKIDEVGEEILGDMIRNEDGSKKEGAFVADGTFDKFLQKLESTGVAIDDKLYNILGQGVSIRVKANGEFDLVGVDGLDDKIVQTLENLIQEGLNNWAAKTVKEDPNVPTSKDIPVEETYTGGTRVASFADVAESFLLQHQFEHGDVGEHEHVVEIQLGGTSKDVRVVSPEADQEQHRINQETTDALGEQLTAMLNDNGIDTSGVSFEVDASGKITVLGGDALNANKAQDLVDAFVNQARVEGGRIGDDEAVEKTGANDSRYKTLTKDPDREAAHTPEGFVKRDVVIDSESEKARAEDEERQSKISSEAQKKILKFFPGDSEEEKRVRTTYTAWQTLMPKYLEGQVLSLGSNFTVSDVRQPRFHSGQGDGYAKDAVGNYLKLMDGFNQLHDGRLGTTYRSSR